ncbi:hypothetical protein [Actinoplanes regularis]|uniref:Uncharacterized protein n=1 Tax=Actinoplanes regularis TaxID=52697 RepID=A0A239I7I4_9ACTN|nr:hypothetical protein [Actinoplanes regularis]GIE91314.1 hypothetical protein Are01nite_77940 [Actinoplanes regularis]SNS89342.1 hypothetical protein SAMN06264365_127118 [Actinoplanes regularis]
MTSIARPSTEANAAMAAAAAAWIRALMGAIVRLRQRRTVARTDIDDLLDHYQTRYARMLLPNSAAS